MFGATLASLSLLNQSTAGAAAGSYVGSVMAPGGTDWVSLLNSLGGAAKSISPYLLSGASMAMSGQAAQAQLAAAQAQAEAADKEARLMERQANLTMSEAVRDARILARDVLSFESMQRSAYTRTGVTLEGSPLLILEDTRRKGQEEIDAIYNRGRALQRLGFAKAQIVRESGRSALTSAGYSANATALGGLINNAKTLTAAGASSFFSSPGSIPTISF